MIVDDNPANLKLASDLLELEGFVICRCKDANEALENMKECVPELILMDIGLPGMDGVQLMKKIRDEKISGAKIIALTAYAMKGDQERMLSVGFEGYITKPINTRNFGDDVRSYLRIME